ncbi:hypothetical protein SAMN05216378_1551 [Paenibacillus catalpae]|uniref:Uncharacterized protein n=1 Tax=Paenibacillus catalpae TaxID=1045775 RepID=A0A1I1VF99_9BACL|nr:hypothetical protein [Paenibacillus catalpae]SFD81549.1 hypothetical protein SAMN05216378_1551 [Paenibacillus catalpae]
MSTIKLQKTEPVRMPEYRISESESMQYKLLYQIRMGNMSTSELDKLQFLCKSELHQLRSELDTKLQELRDLNNQMQGNTDDNKEKDKESIAA